LCFAGRWSQDCYKYHGTLKASARSVASRSTGVSVSGTNQKAAITMPIMPFCLLCSRFQPKNREVESRFQPKNREVE
jgi:hypothetical protein